MLVFYDPAVKSDENSADSFNKWIDVDDDSIPDLEPFIQAGGNLAHANVGLACDEDSTAHQWTNLVQTLVVSWFYCDMSAFLGA